MGHFLLGGILRYMHPVRLATVHSFPRFRFASCRASPLPAPGGDEVQPSPEVCFVLGGNVGLVWVCRGGMRVSSWIVAVRGWVGGKGGVKLLVGGRLYSGHDGPRDRDSDLAFPAVTHDVPCDPVAAQGRCRGHHACARFGIWCLKQYELAVADSPAWSFLYNPCEGKGLVHLGDVSDFEGDYWLAEVRHAEVRQGVEDRDHGVLVGFGGVGLLACFLGLVGCVS